DERQRGHMRAVAVAPDRTCRERAGGVEPETTVDRAGSAAGHPAQWPRPLAAHTVGPLEAAALARMLDVRHGARADDLGGVAVEVLAPLVVDAVVVRAHEAGDHGTDRRRPVGERLA